ASAHTDAVAQPNPCREAKERAVLGSRDHPFRAPDCGPARGRDRDRALRAAVGWLPGELPGQSIHEHMTVETGAPRRRKDQRVNSGVPQTPRRERRLQSGGLMPEFFAQELLNSFFRLFCKALRVVDGVSVSNVN